MAPISISTLLPGPVQWSNYPTALRTVPFGTYLRNTLMLCALNVLGAVLASTVVAYGFARLQFPGRSALFLVMIATMALIYLGCVLCVRAPSPSSNTRASSNAQFRAVTLFLADGWRGPSPLEQRCCTMTLGGLDA